RETLTEELTQQRSRERDEHRSQQQKAVRVDEWRGRPVHQLQRVVMVYPGNENDREAEQKRKHGWSQGMKSIPQVRSAADVLGRKLDVDDQQRHCDGKDCIAKRFEAGVWIVGHGLVVPGFHRAFYGTMFTGPANAFVSRYKNSCPS